MTFKKRSRRGEISQGNGGINGQTLSEAGWQREGYLREREGMELGIKIVIDLIEQTAEEQDQPGPAPGSAPTLKAQLPGETKKRQRVRKQLPNIPRELSPHPLQPGRFKPSRNDIPRKSPSTTDAVPYIMKQDIPPTDTSPPTPSLRDPPPEAYHAPA